MLLVAGFVSCTKTEYITITPEEDEPDTSTYTIMMYGCGGGNLDSSMVMNIQEALLTGATDRVNFTGQVKFSERYHEDDTLAGTQRFVVGEAGDIWYTPVEVLDSDLKLYDPQNLTDFINWSKQLTAPIKHLDFTMGVTIVDKRVWEFDDYDLAYDEFVFQQKTGWGDWLKINTVTPMGNPDPETYCDIPEDEEIEEPSLEDEIAYILSLIGMW